MIVMTSAGEWYPSGNPREGAEGAYGRPECDSGRVPWGRLSAFAGSR